MRETYDNHPTKAGAAKVIIIFLSLILTLNNLFTPILITFLTHKLFTNIGISHGFNLCSSITQIFSWHNLKNNICIPTLNVNQCYTYDISMIYQDMDRN